MNFDLFGLSDWANDWFERFQKRYNISLGRKTHYLSRLQSGGDYQDGDIANMHQTPLSFLLDDEKTYDIKGVKEVWEQSGQSGLDKRQATVPLMVLIGFDLQSSLREKVLESLQRKKSQTTNAWELCFKRKHGAMRASWRSELTRNGQAHLLIR